LPIIETANAFGAQRTLSITTIPTFCEKTAADVDEIASGIGMVGKLVSADPGFKFFPHMPMAPP